LIAVPALPDEPELSATLSAVFHARLSCLGKAASSSSYVKLNNNADDMSSVTHQDGLWGRAEIDMWRFVAFTVLSFIVVVAYYLLAAILLDIESVYLLAPLLFGQVVPTALSLGVSIALGFWKHEGTWIKRLLVAVAALAMPYATILPAMYLSCSLGDELSCIGSSG
jgi:hypothetical protein